MTPPAGYRVVEVDTYLTTSSFSVPKISSVTQMITEARLIDADDCRALNALCAAQRFRTSRVA